MGTNGFQMEISGTTGEESRPLTTQSRKDSRYICLGMRKCKGFVQVRALHLADGLCHPIFNPQSWHMGERIVVGDQHGRDPRRMGRGRS